MKIRKRMDSTVRDILIGIGLYAIVFEVIGLIFVKNRLSYTLGIVYGAVFTTGLVIHMFCTLDKALDMNPDPASRYIRNCSILRLVVMFASLVVAMLLPHVSVIAVIIMIMGLKISAFLQPLIHKYITINLLKERR